MHLKTKRINSNHIWVLVPVLKQWRLRLVSYILYLFLSSLFLLVNYFYIVKKIQRQHNDTFIEPVIATSYINTGNNVNYSNRHIYENNTMCFNGCVGCGDVNCVGCDDVDCVDCFGCWFVVKCKIFYVMICIWNIIVR